jgi:hypothetical protein
MLNEISGLIVRSPWLWRRSDGRHRLDHRTINSKQGTVRMIVIENGRGGQGE